MKFVWIAAAALALSACNQTPDPPSAAGPIQAVTIEAPSGEYALDKNHASVTIRARHFGLSHYTLRFTELEATLNFNAEAPTQSTLAASIAANSVETDFPGDRDFDAELQNSQWFDAANHPQITFRSTSIELTGPNTGRMIGDLSIRGQTHQATFDVTFNQGYARHPVGAPLSLLGFSARGMVKRSDYGMLVLMPPPGTEAGVSDEVEILIEAEFARPIAPAPGAPAPRPVPPT